jgi:signal transduction histidine kinase
VLLVDSLLAVAVALFDQYAIRQPWDDGHRDGPVALNAPLVALAILPLALRRTRPVLGLALMVVAMGVPGLFVAHDYLFWGGFVPLVLMVYSVARADGGMAGRCAWITPFVLLPFEGWREPELRSPSEILFATTICAAAWVIGRVVHRLDAQERELSAALQELAGQRPGREAAAVLDERSRIAGEMHDVVAHAVSLMVLQVGAARFEVEASGSAGTATELAAVALRAAETAGRGALDDLRRSLVVVRGAPP